MALSLQKNQRVATINTQISPVTCGCSDSQPDNNLEPNCGTPGRSRRLFPSGWTCSFISTPTQHLTLTVLSHLPHCCKKAFDIRSSYFIHNDRLRQLETHEYRESTRISPWLLLKLRPSTRQVLPFHLRSQTPPHIIFTGRCSLGQKLFCSMLRLSSAP